MGKIFKVLAVYDNLTEHFLQPIFSDDEGDAERLFRYQINNIPLWKDNAGDYDLYELGSFDAESGTLVSELHKRLKGSAVVMKGEKDDFQSVEQTSEERNSGRITLSE